MCKVIKYFKISIEFEWDEFLEDDDRWDSLFIRIGNSGWYHAINVYGSEDFSVIESKLNNPYFVHELGNNLFFSNGLVFHKMFIHSYKNMNVVQARRKLKSNYTRSSQDIILKFLKMKNVITT